MRGTVVWFLEGVGGPLGLPYVPKTKELRTAGPMSGRQEKAPKNVFINYVRKLVF